MFPVSLAYVDQPGRSTKTLAGQSLLLSSVDMIMRAEETPEQV